MYITDLSAGDEILITLTPQYPAYISTVGTKVLYRTGKSYEKSQSIPFSEGEATVIINDSRVLVIRFSDRVKPDFSGVAEVDYFAIQSIYLYEGETNATTVAKGLENKQLAPASKIYRKKVILRWKE